jgi:type I restriction enzyme R subunit
MTPEQKAREAIDGLLGKCGWLVQDRAQVNLSAALGVAVREAALKTGEADYLLFADGKAIGTVEAKPEGWTLRGVEEQSGKYSGGMHHGFPAWKTPLPFAYESTGVETHFTNRLDPEPRSREVFAFHHPETLVEWVQQDAQLRAKLRQLPPLITDALWPAQTKAIQNLEQSLAANKPRTLIQMATGSGKTFTAVNFAYRLVKFAGARRVLFLVDRANLGRQAYKEFQQFITPDDGRKFIELYNVQHLRSNKLDSVSRVCITTIQRLYSMLKDEEELAPDLDEASGFQIAQTLFKTPPPVEYNPQIPIETFDFIITDECHRSIYELWRQVLEYFDAFLIGLTATPSKQTIGFFNKNLVMEYSHEKAVADGVNVPYDVYRIRTEITERGSTVKAGFYVDRRSRQTRKVRWQQLDEDLAYEANQLDREVVAPDQIRTVIRTFKEKLPEIFPGRADVPKTLSFAKDDSHADDIVKIIREEFDKGNEFCKKITYRTTGEKTEDLIASFRNSYFPRIAVTVDMIATGTDIKPLEIVFFMRSVRSRTFFEQMKGRGVRVIDPTEFQGVTPDARTKTHFVIVDAVGVCERDKTDSRPLERKRTVTFEKLLETVAFGNCEEDVLTSLAGRLARLGRQLTDKQQDEIKSVSAGKSLHELTGAILDALDPDTVAALGERGQVINAAVAPLASNPPLRSKLIELHKAVEQTIDTVSLDKLVYAGPDEKALEAARNTVRDFEKFIADHKDEITALQIIYSKPHRRRLQFDDIKELAAAIEKPPRRWTTDALWAAYEKVEAASRRLTSVTARQSKRRDAASTQRTLTDLVTLVRLALHVESDLIPFTETVHDRFNDWLAQQESLGRTFTPEQRQWLEMIRDHIATSLAIEHDDFQFTPFIEKGGIGKAAIVFGADLPKVLEELNEALTA